MSSLRYVLADPSETMPFRGRLFRADGETMNPDDGFTKRLVLQGCIKPAAEPETDEALDQLTKDELIALADDRGVDVKSSDTKAEIISAITGAE